MNYINFNNMYTLDDYYEDDITFHSFGDVLSKIINKDKECDNKYEYDYKCNFEVIFVDQNYNITTVDCNLISSYYRDNKLIYITVYYYNNDDDLLPTYYKIQFCGEQYISKNGKSIKDRRFYISDSLLQIRKHMTDDLNDDIFNKLKEIKDMYKKYKVMDYLFLKKKNDKKI